MEKAILKTLAYADIFDYPLKGYEIHKWLIAKRASLKQVDKALNRLRSKGIIATKGGFYFLLGRQNLVQKRRQRLQQSRKYLFKTLLLTRPLRLIPWIKLVGISGGLAMDNARKADDIDLFLITQKNRLYLCRILVMLFLGLFRRHKRAKKGTVKGRFCLNLFVDEQNLKQDRADLYTAHEVLQMRPIWERGDIYQHYLEENAWAFRYLPNWTGEIRSKNLVLSIKGKNKKIHNTNYIIHTAFNLLEFFARWAQLKYMGKPTGLERVSDGFLYFHPEDYRTAVLIEFKRRVSTS